MLGAVGIQRSGPSFWKLERHWLKSEYPYWYNYTDNVRVGGKFKSKYLYDINISITSLPYNLSHCGKNEMEIIQGGSYSDQYWFTVSE